jgi:HK97 family phage major capsid protein
MATRLEKIESRLREVKSSLKPLAERNNAFNEAETALWKSLVEEQNVLEGERDELLDRNERKERADRVLPDTTPSRSFSFKKGTQTKFDSINERDLQNVNGDRVRDAALSYLEDAPAEQYHGETNVERIADIVARDDQTGADLARMTVATSTPEYRDAWVAYMSGGLVECDDSQKSLLKRALTARDERGPQGERAMTAGTGSSGGYLVPLYLDPTLVITGAGTANQIRKISRTEDISTLVYNGSTAGQITMSEVTEAGVFSDNSPTLTQVQFSMLKAGAYVPASFEAVQDIEGLVNSVGALFADAKANYEANRLTVGNGTTQPQGVVTGVNAVTASRVSPATGGAFVVGDVYTTHQSLAPRHRQGDPSKRAFLANVSIINKMRQFATANNYHAFLTDLGGGQPQNLIGDQLIEASDMDSTTTTGTKILLYGNFERFLIVTRIGLTTEFIPHLFDQATGRPSGQRAWLCHYRLNAKVNDASAFELLVL